MPTRLLPAFLFLLSVIPIKAESRVWTDTDGRALEAELADVKADLVIVKRASDHREFTIPLKRLSKEDIAYVDSLSSNIATDVPSESKFPEDGLVWPSKISAPDDFEVEIVREDGKENIYIYRSNNFEFVSDVKLARKVVRDFAEIFEATLAAIQAMPLQWDIKISENGFSARLFETRDAYIAAGGIEGSGGVYFPQRREILVPLDSLGTEKSSSGMTLSDEAHGVLIHEITHQVQHDWLRKMPTWLSEGMAEYTEAIPYERGQFRFNRRDVEKAIRQNGWNPKEVTLIDIERLMNISSAEWLSNFELNSFDVSRFYNSAFLLTYYFIHLDGDGDGRRFWNYLRALENTKNRDDIRKAQEILLDGRTHEELLKEIKRKYRSEGIKLQVF